MYGADRGSRLEPRLPPHLEASLSGVAPPQKLRSGSLSPVSRTHRSPRGRLLGSTSARSRSLSAVGDTTVNEDGCLELLRRCVRLASMKPEKIIYQERQIAHHHGEYVHHTRRVVVGDWPAVGPETCLNESLSGAWITDELLICPGCGLDCT